MRVNDRQVLTWYYSYPCVVYMWWKKRSVSIVLTGYEIQGRKLIVTSCQEDFCGEEQCCMRQRFRCEVCPNEKENGPW